MRKHLLCILVVVFCYAVVATLPSTATAGSAQGCDIYSHMAAPPPNCIFEVWAKAVIAPTELAYHVKSWSVSPSTAAPGGAFWFYVWDEDFCILEWQTLVHLEEDQSATTTVTFKNPQHECTVSIVTVCSHP